MQPSFDLVVRNGLVATDTGGFHADVGIRDGTIVAVDSALGEGAAEIDASGKLVLPGGIDSHCHVEQESSSGLMTADDFHSATVAAACGGTTTIVPFAAQHRGQDLREVAARYRERACHTAIVDYSVHLIVSDPTADALRQHLPALIADGYPSFKVYTTYDALKLTDRQLIDVMTVARDQRAVVMVHAENHDAIAWAAERLVAEGRTAPLYHAHARPVAVEREAVHRVAALAELSGATVLVVHVSSRQALDEIRAARSRGARVYAETCPHYLLLTADELRRPGFEAAKFLCSPPLREAEDLDALWQGLSDGSIDVLSSDHAPYRLNDPLGKAVHGPDAPFTRIPNGVPGLETCLPVVFSEGVGRGRLTLERFVAISATNAARIYGLFPRKGTIQPGSDADLAIWDPDVETTITNERLHHRMDYTAFEGMRVRGWPVVTISRGEVIQRDGAVTAEAGRGRFIARAAP
ncbi:MAG: dihydropyrimidinase [Bacteroidales bacterium]